MLRESTYLLGIGLSRAGSTWLYDNLAAQEWTTTPRIKDLYFFDRHYDRGAQWYFDAFERNTDHTADRGTAGPVDTGTDVRVDISHDYVESPLVPSRIVETLGDQARCVLVLREPVAWLESQIRYAIQVGAACRGEQGDLSAWNGTMAMGHFDRLLEPWRPLLDSGQLLILPFDDLVADGPETLRRIAAHAGRQSVDVALDRSEKRSNSSALPRHPGLAKASRLVGQQLRTIGAVDLLGAAKSNPLIRRTLFRSTGTNENLFVFSEQARLELRNFYAEGVLALDQDLPGIARRWGYQNPVDLSDPRSEAIGLIARST